MSQYRGSSLTREEQSAERGQRAARRTINQQNLIYNPVTDDFEYEDDFKDCETSFNTSLNLDGAPGDSSETQSSASTMTDATARAAAALAAEKAKPFEESNFPDDDDAWKKELKIKPR